jgi:hypothetical protein
MAAMELDHGGGVPAWRLTGGGSEVGEKLQGSKTVRLITLVRVEVVGRIDLHDRSSGGEVDDDGGASVVNR